VPSITPTRERAVLASLTAKYGHPDHPEVVAARHAFRKARGTGIVRELAADPTLTDADRAELAALLSVRAELAVSA